LLRAFCDITLAGGRGKYNNTNNIESGEEKVGDSALKALGWDVY
jgi:hypothetical protein